MKRFFNLFRLDSLITIRSGFHYVIMGLAVLFIILVNFVIPSSIFNQQEEIIHDGTDDMVLKTLVESSGEDVMVFEDYEDFIARVEDDRSVIGISVTGDLLELDYEIVSQNRLSSKAVRIIKAGLELITFRLTGTMKGPEIKYEILDEDPVSVPFNKDLVPIFIALEVAMFGFILIAVMVFQEKDEKSLRAYQVSPGRTLQYIWSKVIVITVLGFFYGISVLLLTVGFSADYFSLIIIIILSSIFITSLGLTLSVFFKNISEFLIVSVLTLGILQLPTISYFNPNFSPVYLRWFPTHPIMFGVRQAMFYPEKGLGFLVPIVITLVIEIGLVQIACYFAVKKKLMSGGVEL